MKILIVVTSHDTFGDTGRKTGLWLEEFITPYYIFAEAGASITLASPCGGPVPVDPESLKQEHWTENIRKFENDPETQNLLESTIPLPSVDPDDFDALFYPGGHGPMWDIVDNTYSIGIIESFIASGKPVASVCHGPVALIHAEKPGGEPVLKGRRATCFSNSEETAVGLANEVPFLLEDRLKDRGAEYIKGEDWTAHAVTDGPVITGQNPASSSLVAELLLNEIQKGS